MKILILSDIEASGEWLSQQSFISYLKYIHPNYRFDLISYGKNQLLLNKHIFERISIIKKPVFNRPFKYYRQLIAEFIEAVKIVRKFQDIEMIIGTDYMLLLASFFVFPFKPRIFFFQGFRHFYKVSSYSFNHYMIIRKFLERLTFFLSTKLIVPSKFAMEIVKKELGIFAFFKKFYLFPNICRPEFIKEYSHKELQSFRKKYRLSNSRYVVYAGVIEKRKSLYELIEGYSRLIRSKKRIKLIIVYLTPKMETDYFEQLQLQVKKKGIEKSVIFLKDFGPSDLAKLFRISSVGILPSKLEMGSVFIKEALESSLPVIASKTGETSESLKRISPNLVLQDISPSSIFKSLSKFFGQPDYKVQDLRNRIKKQLYFMRKKQLYFFNKISL